MNISERDVSQTRRGAIEIEERSCLYCGVLYTPRRKHGAYCRPEHRKLAWIEKEKEKIRQQVYAELSNQIKKSERGER